MGGAKHIRLFGLLVLAGITAACGFAPIYGDNSVQYAAADHLRLIEITKIQGAPGTERLRQVLIGELNDTFRGGDQSEYSLEIAITESFEPMGIRPDGSASREQYILEAHYNLKDNVSGNILEESDVTARNAYDVVLSDFSNFQAREDSAQRGIKEIARSISLRLGLYFSDRDR